MAQRAVLICGASGSGKSALSLALMAIGASLLADDRVVLAPFKDALLASCPERLAGMIEARGVGILNSAPADPAPVALVVDMDTLESARLPPRREVTLEGVKLPLLHRVDGIHFAPAIRQWMHAGRSS